MNLSPRARLLLEIWWLVLSLALMIFGWINYNAGKGHWYLIAAIFGVLFFVYSVGSSLYYWRFHQSKSKRK
jgi:hypothetical protein